MTYTKTTWTDRAVQYPSRFTRTTDGTYDTLVPAPGTITQSGTPITATALNNLETQYDQVVSLLQSLGLNGVNKNTTYQGDCNALTTTGFYYTNASTNTPNGTNGYLIVQTYQSGYTSQIFTQVDTGYMYIRKAYAGNWTAWDRITTVGTDFTKSLGGSGYQKLPSGLMIQWGAGSSIANGQNVPFNISFPSSCVSVVANQNTSGTPIVVGVSGFSASGFHTYASQTVNLFYIAIGY